MNDNIRKKEILFVIPSLAVGGAERMVQLLLRHVDRKCFGIKIVIFNTTIEYDIPDSIELTCLNKKGRHDFFRLVLRLAGIITRYRPAVVVSFLTYANYLTILSNSIAKYKSRALIVEQGDTMRLMKEERFFFIKSFFVKLLYPLADKIIVLSNGCAEALSRNFNIPQNKIEVIYNAVDLESVKRLAAEAPDHRWFNPKDAPVIISVGRLTRVKGQSLLLKAFSLARTKMPSRLVIIGDGEDREALEKTAEELKICDDVAFLGVKKNPFNYIANSDVFVLSSLSEGFGNVIIESMACGTPVVSFDCPYGPREIISHNVNGILVPPGDVAALASAIESVLKNHAMRESLAMSGRKRARDFMVEKIVVQYESVFQKALNGANALGG